MNREIDGKEGFKITAKEISVLIEKQFKLIRKGHYVHIGVSEAVVDVLVMKDGWASDKDYYLDEHIDLIFDSFETVNVKYIKILTKMEMLLRGIA